MSQSSSFIHFLLIWQQKNILIIFFFCLSVEKGNKNNGKCLRMPADDSLPCLNYLRKALFLTVLLKALDILLVFWKPASNDWVMIIKHFSYIFFFSLQGTTVPTE